MPNYDFCISETNFINVLFQTTAFILNFILPRLWKIWTHFVSFSKNIFHSEMWSPNLLLKTWSIFMYTVNVLRIIAMQEDIGERRRVFLYMYSLKSLIYVFLDPCIPVFNGHDDFFFFFHCIQKQFMERVANFLFSFPLLLFYSNSFRRRVLLPTQLWGKKGIYQQSLFM